LLLFLRSHLWEYKKPVVSAILLFNGIISGQLGFLYSDLNGSKGKTFTAETAESIEHEFNRTQYQKPLGTSQHRVLLYFMLIVPESSVL
jgi:hypothetical protein